MSLFRIILLGTYLAGCATLMLSIALRLGVELGDLTARGAVGFAAACFLCTLATHALAGACEKYKEQTKVPTQARSAAA